MEVAATADRRHPDLSTVAKDERLSIQIMRGELNLQSNAKQNHLCATNATTA